MPEGWARTRRCWMRPCPSEGATACAWTQLVKLAWINSTEASEYVGSLDETGTAVYFDRAGAADIEGFVMATRVPGQAFQDLRPLEGLSNDETFRADQEVSSTGLEIIFYTSRNLWAVMRTSTELSFEPAEEIGIEGVCPCMSGDGRAL